MASTVTRITVAPAILTSEHAATLSFGPAGEDRAQRTPLFQRHHGTVALDIGGREMADHLGDGELFSAITNSLLSRAHDYRRSECLTD